MPPRFLRFLVGLLGLASLPSLAQTAPRAGREELLFDFGWRFHLGNAADQDADFGYGSGSDLKKAGGFKALGAPAYDDRAWTAIRLPHDWAVDLPFDRTAEGLNGYKPLGRKSPATSIGWYRRVFDIPATDSGRRITIRFDGAFRDSVIWVNGFRLGRNEGGYGGFSFEVGDYLHYGGQNVVLVRVDATAHEGWWYEGAGLYRHAWLVKTAQVHLPSDPPQVTTTINGENSAAVSVRTEVGNEGSTDVVARVRSTLLDPDGRLVAEATSEALTIKPLARVAPLQQLTVSHPQLWSLDSPNLYRLVTTVLDSTGPLDAMTTYVGLRTFRFDPDEGFFLNGHHVEIQGVCFHQDFSGAGVALPDSLQVYRLENLKQYGVNAYRTSHNPPTRELLDACDRLGILVMDEVRQSGSTPEDLRLLKEMVRRDRDHPSIVLWSIGNEEPMQDRDEGYQVGLAMKRVVESLDATRPVTAAINVGSGEGFSRVVDVRGFNYRLKDIDTYHHDHPLQPLVGSEVADSHSTRGEYETNAARGVISTFETNGKIVGSSTPEAWWSFYATRSFLPGGFVWTAYDNRGEPKPFYWPDVTSHYGFLDYCGFPKDHAFYYLAWWTKTPTVHLTPHWTWPGREGQMITVRADSACEQVELFLNGTSLGRQAMPRYGHLEWKVPYAPGELKAVGFDGNQAAASTTVRTAGEARRMVLSPDRTHLAADAEDVAVVNVVIQDQGGTVVPGSENPVTFKVSGPAEILGVGNGNPTSLEADHADRRMAFHGLCQVLVRSTGQAGSIMVAATSPGLGTATVELTSDPVERRPAVALSTVAPTAEPPAVTPATGK